jgi:transposase-like protein
MNIDHDVVCDTNPRMRRSAGQWAKLIAAQRDSGVSIVAFCRQHGLAASTFHAWRKRLGPPQAPQAPQAPESPPGTPPATAASADQTFVRLLVSGGAVHDTGRASPVVVRFADGVEVHIGGERLRDVLAVLRGASSPCSPSSESIGRGAR